MNETAFDFFGSRFQFTKEERQGCTDEVFT